MVRFPLSAAMAVVTIGALGAVGGSLSGCVVGVVGGGAVTGYAVLAEDLSPEQQLQDFKIQAQASAAWGAFNQEMAHRLDATVFDGQVLITGRVPNRRWREEAAGRARRIAGVRRVFDQMSVGPDSHFIDAARDTWITTQLRGELIADIDIKSINYTIKTNDRIVYILGVARTQSELSRVTHHASTVAGVRRVVSFITLLAARAPREEQLNRPPPEDEGYSEPGVNAAPDDDQGAPPPPSSSPPPPSGGGGRGGGTIKAEPLGPQ